MTTPKPVQTYSRVRPDAGFWTVSEANRAHLKGQKLKVWWARNAENVWASVIVLGVWWFAWLCAGYL